MIASTVIVICLLVLPNSCKTENSKLQPVKARSFSDDDTFGNQSCPTWFVPSNDTLRPCVCGSTVGGTLVKCQEDQNQSLLLVGFCMTHNDSTGVTVVGSCPFNYHQVHIQQVYVNLRMLQSSTVLCVEDWIGLVNCVANVKIAWGQLYSPMIWNVWNACLLVTVGWYMYWLHLFQPLSSFS